MRRSFLIITEVLLTAGCAVFNPPFAKWPLRGDYFCAWNPDSTGSSRKTIVAQDGDRRTIRVGEPVKPQQRTCFRWPFIGDRGRLGLVTEGRDTTWGQWFEPWANVDQQRGKNRDFES